MAAIDISGSQESNESTDTSVISIDSPMKSNGTVIEIRSDSEQEDQRKVNVVDEICEEHEQSTGTATENQNENNVSANDVIITNTDVSGTISCSSILTTVNSLKRIKSREGRRYRSTNKPNGIFSYENEPSSSEENQSKSRRNSLRNSKRIKKHRSKIMDENDNEKKETVNENIKSIKNRLGSKNISHNSIKNGSDRNGYVDSSWENLSEVGKIKKGIRQVQNFFDQGMCRKIEKKIDQISEKAKCGLYRQKTYDRAPLRNKYFFGEGYTYGKQMDKKGPGQERLHKKGDVDDIPNWIKKHIIQKLYDENIVPEGFINSAVINEYFPGGCIVSHIDPIHIFDRPIISINFNSKSYLSFGCRFSFNPIRTTDPVHAIPLERGCLTMISGYAADNVTHCIRPQDVTERRCVIILRRVFPDAPRVDDETAIELPLRNAQWSHKPFQSLNFEDERGADNNTYNTRKRSRTKDFYEHDDRAIDEHRHNKRKRHSY